ncbi:hypothetical protein QX205_21165 [Acinetobacter pittii]|uniref:hypothetical protein n=1 Tax=Acinetobacter pittii TaxID=48296 RepID=UPI0025B47C6F|nr:hypothetical protein [Acinetobacter pittii]MDN4022544.1 hypothetical protein [Acinetobacter pittii]
MHQNVVILYIVGSSSSNLQLKLSDQRAQSMVSALNKAGIESSRLILSLLGNPP